SRRFCFIFIFLIFLYDIVNFFINIGNDSGINFVSCYFTYNQFEAVFIIRSSINLFTMENLFNKGVIWLIGFPGTIENMVYIPCIISKGWEQKSCHRFI